MIRLIVGNKGSGKTKRLIDMVNEAAATSKGNVICVEKTTKLNNDLNRKVRLIDINEYDVRGYDALYGFIIGLYSANYDTTDIFIDQTLKIGGDNVIDFSQMIEHLRPIIAREGFSITFAVSCDPSVLPASLKEFII